MVKSLKFNNKEELRLFSELASQQDFGIYISTTFGQLDAKSLLALFTIMGKEVNIVVPDHANPKDFQAFIREYEKLTMR